MVRLAGGNGEAHLVIPSLSPAADGFTSREAELSTLNVRKDGGARQFCIHGRGGVGKTQLALKFAAESAGFQLDMRGSKGSPRTPADAMKALLCRLDNEGGPLPTDESELQGRYLDALRGQKAVVLLDDVLDESQVEPLVPPESCLLIVTSRQHIVLRGPHKSRCCVPLDPMTLDAAVGLLRETAERSIDDASAQTIAELCECIPLLLEKAGAAFERDEVLTPSEYVTMLRDRKTLMAETGAEAVIGATVNMMQPALQKRWLGLAVFRGAFDPEEAAAIWEEEILPAKAALGDLIAWHMVEWDGTPRGYRVPNLSRDYAVTKLADSDRLRGHELAAKYYVGLLANYVDIAKGQTTEKQTSLLRFYCFEDPTWQNHLTEWLWHQAQVKGERSGWVDLAHIFFGAFWWWDEYIEFPFVGHVLARWCETQEDDGDQRIAALLRQFREEYPRGSLWRTRDGHPGWEAARQALVEIRSVLGCDESDAGADVARQAVTAITTIYMAECYQWRAKDRDELRASDCAEALRLYDASRLAFAALDDKATEVSTAGVAYDWSVPYAYYEMAELLGRMGRPDEALAAVRDGLGCPQFDNDYEAASWLYRTAGDVYCSINRAQEAWTAYTLAAWSAFVFQIIRPPSDPYTVTLYQEVTDRLADHLREMPRADAIARIDALRAFWEPYWRVKGEPWPAVDIETALADAAIPLGPAFMPPPSALADEEYERLAQRVRQDPEAKRRVSELKSNLPDFPEGADDGDVDSRTR